jgi:hypothetical protein
LPSFIVLHLIGLTACRQVENYGFLQFTILVLSACRHRIIGALAECRKFKAKPIH